MKLLLAAIAALLPFAAASDAATTYNALSDFSTTENPNGVWTFGRSTANNGGTFTAYPDFVVDGVYSVWRDNSHLSEGAPSVWLRTDQGALNFHPGPGGAFDEFSIIRFTAPAAGNYTYTANFLSVDSGTKNVWVFHNADQLHADTISGAGASSDFGSLTLAPGDTVDIVVGPAGGYQNDATGISFVVEAVPEPSAVALFGLTGLGLAVRRRRRN